LRRNAYARTVRGLGAVGLLSFVAQAFTALQFGGLVPQLHFSAVYASGWAFGALLLLVFAWPSVRARMGQECVACGYDLTGTLAAGISACPECGAVVDAEKSAKPQAA
jgi:predicted RNA-binding Zn-ribbon protein involved in translation (DUF1610 family)